MIASYCRVQCFDYAQFLTLSGTRLLDVDAGCCYWILCSMFIHSDGLYSCSLCVLVPTASRATKSSIIWHDERLTTPQALISAVLTSASATKLPQSMKKSHILQHRHYSFGTLFAQILHSLFWVMPSRFQCFKSYSKYVYRFSHCFSKMSVAFSSLLFNKFEFELMCIAINSQTPLVRIVDFFYNNFTTIRTSR